MVFDALFMYESISRTDRMFSNLGDCCLPVIDSYFCSECICHEDGTRHPDGQGNIGTTLITQPTETYVYGTCSFSSFSGDGQCDETNNNPECNYDDG